MENIDPTLEHLEGEIATRLQPVCTEMSPQEFLELVRDIARVKLKYEPEARAG